MVTAGPCSNQENKPILGETDAYKSGLFVGLS